jgi:hypothetical protein
MRIAVLIPSHIHYEGQIKLLDECLLSLSLQTKLPDVYVSISFSKEDYKNNIATLIRKYPTVKFKLSKTQKYQMEHILNLVQYVLNYDMLMFCDDDDTYNKKRCEIFSNAFEYTKIECIENKLIFGGVFEDVNIYNEKSESRVAIEYWGYGLSPQLLIEFYKRTIGFEDLLCHHYGDMYLRNYLYRIYPNTIQFGRIPIKLYNYNIDNPNSITGKIQNQKKHLITPDINNNNIRDNLILSYICQNTDMINKIMKEAHIPIGKIAQVLPCVEKIKTFTNILYK